MRKTLARAFVVLSLSAIGAGAQTVTVTALISPLAFPPVIDATTSSFSIPGDVGTVNAPKFTGSSGVFSGLVGTAPPYNATVYSTAPYFAAHNGSVTLTFTNPQTDFQMLWGSIDPNNAVDFFNGGSQIFTITGQVLHDSYDSSISLGDAIDAGGTRLVDFNFSGVNTFDSIQFIGSGDGSNGTGAAEFNVVGAAGPIPGAGLLSYIALGLVGLGSCWWKRLRALWRRRGGRQLTGGLWLGSS